MPRYDPTFDLSSEAAQLSMVKTCTELQSRGCDADGCMDGTQKLARPNGVQCFMADFHKWHAERKCAVCEDDPTSEIAAAGSDCGAVLKLAGIR